MAIQVGWQIIAEERTTEILEAATGRITPTRRGAPRPIARIVEADAHSLELIGLLGRVPAGEASLHINGAISDPFELHRTYAATLRFAGLVPLSHKVVVEIAPHGTRFATITVRSAALPRRLAAERYFAAVESALSSIERLLPWQAASTPPAGGTIELLSVDDDGSDDEAAA